MTEKKRLRKIKTVPGLCYQTGNCTLALFCQNLPRRLCVVLLERLA